MRRVLSRFQRFWWVTVPCLLITLTACGGAPVVGTVVEKVYDDPDMTVQNVTTCTKTCTVSIIPVSEPERWLLKVARDSDGEIETVQVDPFTWQRVYVGDAYSETAETR